MVTAGSGARAYHPHAKGAAAKPEDLCAGSPRSIAMLFQAGITGCVPGACAAGESTQDAFPVLKGPYLGQKWAGPGSELFGPHIVSTGFFESDMAIAPDGRACYFTVTLSPALSVIVGMKQEKGIWTAPEVAPFSQGQGDGNPAIAPDGKFLFFSRFNQRPLPGTDPKTPLTYKEMPNYFSGPQNGLRDIFWIEARVVQRLRSLSKWRGRT